MASNAEGTTVQDVVKMEGATRYSREMLVIEESMTLTIGEVCRADAVTSRMRALAAAGDGAEADAIILEDVTTAGGETTTTGVFLVRHAIVDEALLDFGSGTEADAKAALANVGIVCRDEPTMVALN